MRRILAGVAAIAMIVGGFLVWDARQTGSGGGTTGTSSRIRSLWCVPEAEAACSGLSGRDVTVLGPAEIEKRIVKAGTNPSSLGVDAIVATRQWLDRWAQQSSGLTVDTTPVASTELVAVEKDSSPLDCKGSLECLLTRAGDRLALPDPPTTSSGTIAAAMALQARGISDLVDDSDPDLLAAVNELKRTLTTPRTPKETLTSLVTLNLLDAVVITRADFAAVSPAGATATALQPTASVTLHIGVFGQADPSGLRSELRTRLTDNGFTAPTPPGAGQPTSDFLNATYNLLR